VHVDVPAHLGDELAGSMTGFALGVETAEAGPGRVRLSVFLEDEPSARDAAARLRRVLDELVGPAGPDSDPTVETVGDDRWVERYQAGLRPRPLGERFVVLPREASPAPAAERIAIRMVPGRAFGTGEHPTTRLCAAALEHRVGPGSTWLDVGTGSGILAIVAARCGAARVLAVDVDPDAIEVAREWIELNDVAGVVELRAGSAAALGDEVADGAVVNVSAAFLVDERETLAARLRDGGELIASGLLAEESDAVRDGLEASGFRQTDRTRMGAWGCLVMRKRG
jgi:ribosomal protein L11 methyltransferase